METKNTPERSPLEQARVAIDEKLFVGEIAVTDALPLFMRLQRELLRELNSSNISADSMMAEIKRSVEQMSRKIQMLTPDADLENLNMFVANAELMTESLSKIKTTPVVVTNTAVREPMTSAKGISTPKKSATVTVPEKAPVEADMQESENPLNDVAKMIKDKRAELNLTQTALAKQIPTQAGLISHLENGRAMMNVANFEKLLSILGFDESTTEQLREKYISAKK